MCLFAKAIATALITIQLFCGAASGQEQANGPAAEAFNIYMRLKGQPAFKLIATNRSRFPFDDDAPLAQNGVPETREYQAMGVVADKEIGQPSDIVSVLYGG